MPKKFNKMYGNSFTNVIFVSFTLFFCIPYKRNMKLISAGNLRFNNTTRVSNTVLWKEVAIKSTIKIVIK